jgi:hypothetical protein
VRLAIATALWLLPAAALAGRGVSVEGDSSCPSPAQVARRAAALADVGAPAARARVDRSGAALRVRLTDERGGAIAERTLAATGTCDELAEVVAVTLVAWVAELRPERVPSLQLPASPQPEPAPPPSLATWDLGAGVGAGVAQGGAAVGASVLAAVHAGASGWGVAVRASGAGEREVAVGAYTAAWRRWELAIGPSFQRPLGAWRLAASAGLAAGWLTAEGRNFPRNQSASRFSPGASGYVQLGRPFGAWCPWAALAASAAFRDEPLTIAGSAEDRSLRPLTLELLLGVSVRLAGALAPR